MKRRFGAGRGARQLALEGAEREDRAVVADDDRDVGRHGGWTAHLRDPGSPGSR
jgi:hypothetical protein